MVDRARSYATFFPPHFPLPCFCWQRRELCENREDCKCRVFYYLALKAQYAATVIISTAVLFDKIVKDDETVEPVSDIPPCLVIEGSVRLPKPLFCFWLGG